MSSKYPRKIEKMWKKTPYCYYCGIKTILYKDLKKEDNPDYQATIEHLISKVNPLQNEIIFKKMQIP